jgi:UDP-glucose 4-epimerase
MNALRPGDARFYNLGIGRGYSVREVIDSVQRVTGKRVPVEYGPRRPGDPAELFANAQKIHDELGWQARHAEIDEIVATAWNWFKDHPHGYAD